MKEDSDEFSELFADVPLRDAPSAQSTQLAHAALNDEWQLAVARKRKQRKQWQSFSMAAGIMLMAVVGVVSWPENPLDTLQVQSAQRLLLDTHPVNDETFSIGPEQTLVAVSDASLAAGDLQLRLAAGTELIWNGHSEVQLNKGQLYVDAVGDSTLLVRTRYGTVADIGTQFLLTLLDNELHASVREGTIFIEANDNQHTASPRENEAAVVVLSENKIQQHFEAKSNTRWNWVHDTPTRYESERVEELLELISHDLGKRIEFASKGVEASVATMRINGELNPAKPRETLEIITRSSNLRYAENERTIKIDRLH
ncbi:MAG: FecR domain-containing protein [Pseudomonadales bacterium]